MITDPYTYENGTLKNKLNITDYQTLNKAEADIGFLKLINIDSVHNETLDEKLLQNIHKHIFEDIFDWAGLYRTVTLYKQEVVLPGLSLNYAYPNEIASKLKLGLIDLINTDFNMDNIDELSYIFARKLALLWKIHPFRDGNTRTFLSYAYIFAKEKGFPFDMKVFIDDLSRRYNDNGTVKRYSIRDKFVLASLDEKNYPEVEHLAITFKRGILKYQEENKNIKRK